MLVMQGVMEGQTVRDASASSASPQVDWLLSDHYVAHPTYYGMTSAMYTSSRCRPAAA